MRHPFTRWLPSLALAGLFALTVFRFADLEALMAPAAKRKGSVAERTGLPALALQHLAIVGATSGASFLLAFPLGLLASGARARPARELLLKAAAFGETIPTVALMALIVPSLGYGFLPVASALFLYGLLPVFRNTLAGLSSTPPELVDAGLGSGMTEGQVLLRVKLPHAAPLIVQGLRVSLIVNIAAATVGAAVGSGGFGVPIVSGLRAFDTVLILEGSLPVAFLALAADSALRAFEEGL
jgi:osmoprotectant transport system permease protein